MKRKLYRLVAGAGGRSDRNRQLARRQLYAVAAIALLGAAIAALLVFWEQKAAISQERLVSIYRKHGCVCALEWKRSLENAGFEVQMFEPDSMNPIRAKLQTPRQLRGCHVGVYLGYYLEGHVPAEALEKLTTDRPVAKGVVMESSWLGKDVNFTNAERGQAILLLGKNGASRRWISPPRR